jgi:hypothetical protein
MATTPGVFSGKHIESEKLKRRYRMLYRNMHR